MDVSGPREPRKHTRTPAYEAIHAAQYLRKGLIRSIEEATGRPLICYVGGAKTNISADDTVFLMELLHNVDRDQDLDFLLHTGGGDMDSAEKLITILRKTVGTHELRFIVPDFAKSAGTLMALGADVILMSDSSELGPIDPQIVLDDGQGNRVNTPIQSYLDAFARWTSALAKDPSDLVAQMMIQKFDPARTKLFESARLRARVIAENQLREGMFRPPRVGNITGIAGELLNTGRYLSHSQMISPQEALKLGLNVVVEARESLLWTKIWQLYCHQRIEVKDKQKLFESNFAFLTLDS